MVLLFSFFIDFQYYWYFTHLFVTLALSKILPFGNEKKSSTFLLHFTHLFVTLPSNN